MSVSICLSLAVWCRGSFSLYCMRSVINISLLPWVSLPLRLGRRRWSKLRQVTKSQRHLDIGYLLFCIFESILAKHACLLCLLQISCYTCNLLRNECNGIN